MSEEMPDSKKPVSALSPSSPGKKYGKIRLEAYGREMLEKEVGSGGASGRLYLPKVWVGRRVKIIRLD